MSIGLAKCMLLISAFHKLSDDIHKDYFLRSIILKKKKQAEVLTIPLNVIVLIVPKLFSSLRFCYVTCFYRCHILQ